MNYIVAWGYHGECFAEYDTFAPALMRYRTHVREYGVDSATLSGSSRSDCDDDGLTQAEREQRDETDYNLCECADILERLDVLHGFNRASLVATYTCAG